LLIIHILVLVHLVIIIKKHHFFLVLTIRYVIIDIIVLHLIIFIHTIHTLFLEFLQLVCVGSSNKLSVHVKYLTLWIHQEFTFISFNLYTAHDHVVFHINTNLIISLSIICILPLADFLVWVLVCQYRWLRTVLFHQILLLILIIILPHTVLHVWVSIFKFILVLKLIIEVQLVSILLLEVLLVLVLLHKQLLLLLVLLVVFIVSTHLVSIIITVLDHFVAHYVLRVWRVSSIVASNVRVVPESSSSWWFSLVVIILMGLLLRLHMLSIHWHSIVGRTCRWVSLLSVCHQVWVSTSFRGVLKRSQLPFSATTTLQGARGCSWILVVSKVLGVDVLLLGIVLSSLCSYTERWSVVDDITVILLIWLPRRWRIVWLLRILVVCLILEVHWVVSLIIKKPFSLEEVLSSIEGRLLLHLLKAVLIWCSIVFVVLVLIFKIGYVTIGVHITRILKIILALRAIVLVIIVYLPLISRWAPVALGNPIDVRTKEVATLRANCTICCSWGSRWARELLMALLYLLTRMLVLSVASH